jgi:hypothetical protein
MNIFQQMEKYLDKFAIPVFGDLSLSEEQYKCIERLADAWFAYGVVWSSAFCGALTNASILQEYELFNLDKNDVMSEVLTNGLLHEQEMIDWVKEQIALGE